MANNCWNHVLISGDKQILDELQAKFESPLKEESFRQFAASFFSEGYITDSVDLGSKWWELWTERNEEDRFLIVCGDSAWCPPHEFLRLISLHYPVKIIGEYEEGGMDFGGTTTYQYGEIDDTCYKYLEWLWVSDSEQFWHELECYAENCEDFAEFKKIYLDDFTTPLSEKDLQDIEKEFNFVNN